MALYMYMFEQVVAKKEKIHRPFVNTFASREKWCLLFKVFFFWSTLGLCVESHLSYISLIVDHTFVWGGREGVKWHMKVLSFVRDVRTFEMTPYSSVSINTDTWRAWCAPWWPRWRCPQVLRDRWRQGYVLSFLTSMISLFYSNIFKTCRFPVLVQMWSFLMWSSHCCSDSRCPFCLSCVVSVRQASGCPDFTS